MDFEFPVYAKLTREGEVELARQLEKAEMLIIEGILSGGIDARATLMHKKSDREDSVHGNDTFSSGLTPRRFEMVTKYVEQIERAQRNDVTQRERESLLRKLVSHRQMTRKLLKANHIFEYSQEIPHNIDRRILLGLAMSKSSREELLCANLYLVTRISKKYIGHGLPLEDLRQEGTIGLMRAIDKFDYRLGYRLITYAEWWIRSFITRALTDTSREIRVPSHAVEMQRKISIAKERLTAGAKNFPSDKSTYRHIEIYNKRLYRLSNLVTQPVSLELPIEGEEDSDRTIGSVVTDTELPLPDDIVASNEMANRVLKTLNTTT